MTDNKELETRIENLTRDLEELKAAQAPPAPPAPAAPVTAPPVNNELAAALTEIRELRDKVTRLENMPQTAPVQPSASPGKVEFVAIVDKRNGTVRSV
jgi:hypothetical protein